MFLGHSSRLLGYQCLFCFFCSLNKVNKKYRSKGYTEQQDDCEEAEGWHVVANRNKMREGRHEVEEVGLVEAL